jgi:hypothetical protein
MARDTCNMNRAEARRVHNVNMANGHLTVVVDYWGVARGPQPPYVAGFACAHCGREYRRRFSDATQHLYKAHGIRWWSKDTAANVEPTTETTTTDHHEE